MAQIFNFEDNGSHFTIQTLNGLIIASDKQYPKNTLTTNVFGNKLYISTVQGQRLVDYTYGIDLCNITANSATELQNQLDIMFASNGAGSVDITTLSKETTQASIRNNVNHKKNRIEGSADYEINLTYLEIEPTIFVINGYTITGTTLIGFESLTAVITYDINKNITKIKYS